MSFSSSSRDSRPSAPPAQPGQVYATPVVGTFLRTWSDRPVDAEVLRTAYEGGRAAGVRCAPAEEPSGRYVDARLVAEWKRGYAAGRAERLDAAHLRRSGR